MAHFSLYVHNDRLKPESFNLSSTKHYREGHGAMVGAWRSADGTGAVRFRIPLGAGFSEKYHVSPLSILGHC